VTKVDHDNLIEFIDHSNMIEAVYDDSEIPNTVNAWEYLKKFNKIGLEQILEVHKRIMLSRNSKIAGKLRNCNVFVGGRSCPYYTLVSGLLREWINKYKKVKTEEEAKQAHIDFEHIHPFEDGNGRTGRLIWLWHRCKANLPFMMIREERRWDYYKWFENVQDTERAKD
jgi:Fic family protein